MKKTKFMRAALLLLVLTLITSCFVGGTFAKYTTSGDGTDTARVAKFGVMVTGNGNLFAKEYAKTDASFTLATNSVVSTEKNVVAPGTSGEMTKMTLTGTPEVAVRVSYTGEAKLDGWMVNDAFYCPLVVKVNETEIKMDDTQITSAEKFAEAINNAIKGYSKVYKAGTDLSTIPNDSLAISWSWGFDGNDVKDTVLGNAAADNNASSITVKVTTTVTQID